MSSFQCSFITAPIVFFEVQMEGGGGNENFCEQQGGAFLLLQKVMVVLSLKKTATRTISSSAIIRIYENNWVTSPRLMVTEPKNINIH